MNAVFRFWRDLLGFPSVRVGQWEVWTLPNKYPGSWVYVGRRRKA